MTFEIWLAELQKADSYYTVSTNAGWSFNTYKDNIFLDVQFQAKHTYFAYMQANISAYSVNNKDMW